MSFDKHLELFLDLNAKAFKQSIKATEAAVRETSGKMASALKQTSTQFKQNLHAASAYNNEIRKSGSFTDSLRGKVVALVGAYAGFQALTGATVKIKEAESAVFTLEASLEAANREFDNVGSLSSWGNTIDLLSNKLRIYSKTDLRLAAAKTIDMTKRLGLNEAQMQEVIEKTANLAAGKDTLTGGIERTTAALRGEAESAELLTLTLGEDYVKAWHAASGAQKTAWKDLSDTEKALARYNLMLEQSVSANGRAAASVGTMSGALALMNAAISDAVGENESAIEAVKELSEYIAENADEIGELAAMLTTAAAETMKFVLANKEVVLGFGAIALGAGVLATVVSSLTTIWRTLNMVMIATTGVKIVPWLTGIITALGSVEVAALGLKGVLGVLGGLFLAWEAGWQIGTLLNKFDIIKKAGIAMAGGITNAMLKAKKAWAWLSGGDTAAVQREIEEAERIYAEMFAEVGKEAKKAAKAHSSVAKSAEDSAEVQAQAQAGATKEMKKAYKDYANTVKKLQDDIAGREQSLAEQLREMSRSGMSDKNAWQDRKKEAQEFADAAKQAEEAAKAAFKAGDAQTGSSKYKEAVDYYDKAREAAAELNREITAGDKVIQSQGQSLRIAKPLVEEYGRAGIEAQKDFQAAIAQTAQALDEQSGGQLSKEMPELAKAFGELSEKAEDLAEQSATFNREWNDAWDSFLADGNDAILELDNKLSKLAKDRTVKVFVEEVEKRMRGGLIGSALLLKEGGAVAVRNMLGGGWLPGFGGGDRRHIIGEDGEFMLNKFSVREAGLAAARYFNNRDWGGLVREIVARFGPGVTSILSRATGGPINDISILPMPSIPAAEFSGSGPGGGTIHHRHDLRTADGRRATVFTDELNAENLIRILRDAEVRGS